MDNIVLINGTCFHLIDKEIQKLVGLNENIIRIRYNNNIDEILNEASYFSLDNTIKIIIVEAKDLFGKSSDDLDKIVSYLSNYNEFSKLIFIASSADARLKAVKQIKEKFKYIDFPKVDYRNVYTYINNYCSEYGYKLDFKIGGYLVNLYGLNLDLIFNELDKLMLYYNKPCTIKYDDAVEIICNVFDDNVFHFTDACINKNMDKALKLYNDLKVYKVEPFFLVIALAKEYRNIFCVKKLVQSHMDIKDIMKELSLQDWQVNKLYEVSYNYSDQELLKNIKILADYDRKLKTGLINKDVAIDCLLLDLFN